MMFLRLCILSQVFGLRHLLTALLKANDLNQLQNRHRLICQYDLLNLNIHACIIKHTSCVCIQDNVEPPLVARVACCKAVG